MGASISGWMPEPGSVFVIAEAGVNHNGDVERAHQLIDIASQAGADAVKFQTFSAERLAGIDAPKAAYQYQTTDTNESQFEMLRKLELSHPAHKELISHCREAGIEFISTPFDETSADFLESLDVRFFKLPSPDITNLPFLAHVARKKKPMVVSTGTACIGEVEAAVGAIQREGNNDIVLLHCLSSYPAPVDQVNLRAITTMKQAFGLPVGYSDHTVGIEVSLAAVALGACVIEKHFTTDKSLPGPDHRASLDPGELASLVSGVRLVQQALGHGRKEPAPSEKDTIVTMRKSLVAAVPIAAGVRLTAAHLTARRPGTGISPARLPEIIGRTARVEIRSGEPLAIAMLE